jgi:hypothetical protein
MPILRVLYLVASVCALSGPGCHSGRVSPEPTAAPHLGEYVLALTTIRLEDDRRYCISHRDEFGREAVEEGAWAWSPEHREFRLTRRAGNVPFALRRLRVDDRNPDRLLWIPDLDSLSMRGAIDYFVFIRVEK